MGTQSRVVDRVLLDYYERIRFGKCVVLVWYGIHIPHMGVVVTML